MPRISVSAHVDATPQEAYDYVEEHTNTVKYVHGLTSWTPVGDQVHGVGSTFRAAMKVGPSTLEGTLRIIEATAPERLAWAPTDGFQQSGAWTFTPAAGGGTDATFEVDVTLPGGVAGRVVGKTLEPAIRGNVTQSVRNLKEQVEALHPAG